LSGFEDAYHQRLGRGKRIDERCVDMVGALARVKMFFAIKIANDG